MTKNIKCQPKSGKRQVRVKVIKAPIVDSKILHQLIFARANAIVL
ncbi:MAG: hypothetical protein Q7T50_05085 [Candidatus Magasanikbacteria bacterium]|nr:hypothetical protein [Candidatus Magasanikbacteria bacterium]